MTHINRGTRMRTSMRLVKTELVTVEEMHQKAERSRTKATGLRWSSADARVRMGSTDVKQQLQRMGAVSCAYWGVLQVRT